MRVLFNIHAGLIYEWSDWRSHEPPICPLLWSVWFSHSGKCFYISYTSTQLLQQIYTIGTNYNNIHILQILHFDPIIFHCVYLVA